MGGSDGNQRRRGEVLVAGLDGVAKPGRGGYLYRLRGRFEGVFGSDCDGISADAGGALHRPPSAGDG